MANELVKTTDWPITNRKPAELKKIIADNIAGQQVSPFTFERWKVPSGGVTKWTVETIDGETLVEEAEGVVIDVYDTRSYWIGSETEAGSGGSGSPPDCSSLDCLRGFGRLADGEENEKRDCSGCEKAEWGSGKMSSGQACKVKKRVFLITPDSVFPIPVALFLPPTSLKAFQNYLFGLLRFGLEPHSVLTRFSLKGDRNEAGQEFARVVPKNVGRLSDEDVKRYAAIKESLMPILRTARIEDWDAGGDDSDDSGPAPKMSTGSKK